MTTTTTKTTVYEVRYYTYADFVAGYATFIVKCKTIKEAEDILRDWHKSKKSQYNGVDIHKVKVTSH
jgi:hypothetical protein